MTFTRTAMSLTLFIVLYTSFIVYMPSEITTPISPQLRPIPSDFDLIKTLGYYTSRVQNISENAMLFNAWSLIDFSPEITYTNNSYIMGNSSQRYGFFWTTATDPDSIELIAFDNVVVAGFFHVDYLPVLDKDDIVEAWDSVNNCSFFSMRSMKNVVGVFIYDTNMTRNDIDACWDEGSLQVELRIYDGVDAVENDVRDLRDGWSLIRAVVSFRLDQEYEMASPIFGYFLSIMFYIPLIFLSLWGINVVVHGGM